MVPLFPLCRSREGLSRSGCVSIVPCVVCIFSPIHGCQGSGRHEWRHLFYEGTKRLFLRSSLPLLKGNSFQDPDSTPTPKTCRFPSDSGWKKETRFRLGKEARVLEIAVGAVFAPARFSLVRISIRDLVADRNPY